MAEGLTWGLRAQQNKLQLPMAPGTPLKNLTEAELVESFRSTGQNAFFEELYLREKRKVFGICFKFLRHGEHAEDLTHETFLRAYRSFSSLEGSNFSAWVCRIAANLSLNWIRDQLNRERLLDPPAPPQTTEPEAWAIQAEELEMAEKILQSLRPEHCRVLLLKYLEGYSNREIEKITGYDREQVRSYLQNARRNFQIRWEKRSFPGGQENYG